MGWYKLLEGVHETFDVVTLREISCGAVNLDRYRYIVVPDCAYIQEDVISRMNEYVQRGGHLITAGRFAERNESGRLLPPSTPTAQRTTIPDHGKAYAGDPRRDTHAGNTPPFVPVASRHTPRPTRHGAKESQRSAECQAATGAIEAFQLLPDDASVSSVQYDGPHEKAVYLVNRGQQPVPAERLELNVPSGAQSVEVYADTRRVETRISDRTVALPAFRTSCIVKLTFALTESQKPGD